MTTKRILSGMQPTNNLHLGNYLGALKNWVKIQEEDAECLYCVVDLHAVTVPQDPAKLKQSTREIAAAYIAAGIDPKRSTIFVQSSVPEHSQLMWALSTMTQVGKLNRMTQFKDKAGKNAEKAGLGLYAYPVLMAADILIYKATHVPVGDDQRQHLELARDIAATFNHRFEDDFFPLPESLILGEGTRVMSLRDGTSKMSKSDASDLSRINFTDDADTIAKKIRKAKTDPDPLPNDEKDFGDRAEARNLISIYAALNDQSVADVLEEYGGQEFSKFKPALADLAVSKLDPINSRMNELLSDVGELDRILEAGGAKARSIASPIMNDVYAQMGFWGHAK